METKVDLQDVEGTSMAEAEGLAQDEFAIFQELSKNSDAVLQLSHKGLKVLAKGLASELRVVKDMHHVGNFRREAALEAIRGTLNWWEFPMESSDKERTVDSLIKLALDFVDGTPVQRKNTKTCKVEVSLDGGATYQPAPNGVRIIYKNIMIDGEDGRGEVHINATHEGLITDIWTTRDEPLDHNIGTESVLIDDIVSRLVADKD